MSLITETCNSVDRHCVRNAIYWGKELKFPSGFVRESKLIGAQ